MTRKELYEMVWTKPVTHVAREYGLSDVAIRKICKKHDIPLPPLGHWAKLRHGKPVLQPSLSPYQAGGSQEIRLVARPRIVMPAAASADLQSQDCQEYDAFEVPATRPDKLHPVTSTTEKALLKAKPDENGFIVAGKSGVFDIRIGPNSAGRAIRILDTIENWARAKYGPSCIDTHGRIVIDEQPLSLRIYENTTEVEHIPTQQELKEQARREDSIRRYPGIYSNDSKAYRNWDHVPSGRLIVEVSDPLQDRWRGNNIFGRWYDRKSKPVEGNLAQIFGALRRGAVIAREQRQIEAEAARVAAEEAARRLDKEKQLRLLKRVTAFFEEKADQHKKLAKIERLGDFLGLPSADNGSENSDLARAFEFVIVNMRQNLSYEKLSLEIAQSRLLDSEKWY